MAISVCVFDAYGTLFDVSAAARKAALQKTDSSLYKDWEKVATLWRLKQLQYTWIRAVAGAHADFWQVTSDSLNWSLEAVGLQNDDSLRQQLLDLYRKLDAYPEVKSMLKCLKANGFKTAILSNGSPSMLDDAVEAAKLTDLFDSILSVEEVGVFKPHQSVYQLVLNKFQCEPHEVLFVSSNGWDAAAASGYGFTTVWVNRNNEPMERLPWIPEHLLNDLTKIPQLSASQK